MYKYLLNICLLVLVVTGIVVIANQRASAVAAPTTFAATLTCKAGEVHPKDYKNETDGDTCCPASAGAEPTALRCFFAKYVNPVVNLLAALVGVVTVGSIIAGGIQYSSAGADPNKVSAAKQRIINSLVALAAFIFLYAFLQWVIPGGIEF